MRKNYKAPSMEVVKIAARQLLSHSQMGINDTTTTQQFAREMDFEDEDW